MVKLSKYKQPYKNLAYECSKIVKMSIEIQNCLMKD